eukprot:ctg_1231.g302
MLANPPTSLQRHPRSPDRISDPRTFFFAATVRQGQLAPTHRCWRSKLRQFRNRTDDKADRVVCNRCSRRSGWHLRRSRLESLDTRPGQVVAQACTQFAAANGNERLSAPHTSSVDPGTSTEPSVVAQRRAPQVRPLRLVVVGRFHSLVAGADQSAAAGRPLDVAYDALLVGDAGGVGGGGGSGVMSQRQPLRRVASVDSGHNRVVSPARCRCRGHRLAARWRPQGGRQSVHLRDRLSHRPVHASHPQRADAHETLRTRAGGHQRHSAPADPVRRATPRAAREFAYPRAVLGVELGGTGAAAVDSASPQLRRLSLQCSLSGAFRGRHAVSRALPRCRARN